jgi:hypothetical protein
VRLTILAAFVLVATPAFSVELFRYRGAAKDGGTLEYVEAGEQNSPNAVTKEKAAEIAADFMTTFYHEQVGALETQEFRTQPVLFWLVCFSDAVKGPRFPQTKFREASRGVRSPGPELLKKIVPSLYCAEVRSDHAIRICRSLRRG